MGKLIQRSVRADKVALWGQELDFIRFLAQQGYQPPPTFEQYREYIELIGIPLIEADNPDYPGYCMKAASNVMS